MKPRTSIESTTAQLAISSIPSSAVNTTTQAVSTSVNAKADAVLTNGPEQKDIPTTSMKYPGNVDVDMNAITNRESTQEQQNDPAYVNYHINQTVIADDDDEFSVVQKGRVPPKSSSSSKELHSRKSISLPPLKTTPLTTRTTSLLSTTKTETKTTVTEAEAITPTAASCNHGNNSASAPPPSMQETPKGSNGRINNNNSNGTCNGGVNSYGLNGYQNDQYVTGYDSTYPPSTEASSPTDHFTSQYILPPIPSFSEMRLKFNKSRTNSAESAEKHNIDAPDDDGEERRSSTPRQYDQSRFGSGQLEDEIVPDFDPFIFDKIQSDENETYILWSSPLDASIGRSSSSITDSVPATPQSSKYGGTLSTVTNCPSTHNMLSQESSSSSSAGKRWSAGETFKSKDKGRDSLESDGTHGQKSSEGGTSEASTAQSLPVSPGFSKPLERFSGTISIKRPISSVVFPSSSSKSTSSNTAVVSNQNTTSNTSEERVIMAATVEKLIEKLTSDIDYTFLTDFFLIYRLFISPLALLKLLLARFHWALTEDTPQRQVVRVRTFVTMRHWLLNYFEYDFMNSRVLRRTHVKSLRELANHPIVSSSVRDKRIVKELRKLYHLKRTIHCREMAQLALERPSTRQSDEPSLRSLQHRGTTNLEWIQSTVAPSSKRSSMDISETRNVRSQLTGLMRVADNRPSRSDDERPSAEESSDNESELSSADGQDDDNNDMYVEEAHFVARGSQQNYQDLSDDETDDTDLDDDSEHRDALSNSSHLPSPAFSAESVKPKKAETDHMSQGLTDNGTDPAYVTSLQAHAGHLYSPDASDYVPHHQRSQTLPRTLDMRSSPRSLFCGDDSSSQYALSPPESPRLLEPYMNPPPRSIMSTEKKKTWSHYMVATVEQFSKVKRALLPKSSPSIQDLRRHSTSSATMQSFTIGAGSAANGGSRGNNQEITGMGNMHTTGARYCSNEDRPYSGSGPIKPSTTANTNAATNSALSSLDGRRLREDQQGDQAGHHPSVASSEWSSDEEEYQSSSFRTQVRGEKANRQSIPPRLTNGEAGGYVMVDQDERRLQQSSPTRSRRPSLPLNELMSANGAAQQDRQSLDWDEVEEEQDVQGDDYSTSFLSNSRALRRTTQKRDNRTSWMTLSSTNSSVFGAVLSQGHLPPSQTVRERNDAGNVDRFMEKLYQDQGQNDTNGLSETGHGGPEIPRRIGTRRKSTEAIRERDIRDGLTKPTPSGSNGAVVGGGASEKTILREGTKQEPRENEHDNSKPGMSARRNHTLAQHPHRQTVPIMHHHYHHHYLQQRQSESLLHQFPAQRRHSVEVQGLGTWRASQQKERNNVQETVVQTPASMTLLEGAAYAAALQETQRQLRMLTSQDNQSSKNTIQAPRVLPHPIGRPMGHARARPLASIGVNSVLQTHQPSENQSRSSLDPNLLYVADWEINSPATPPPKPNPAIRGAVGGGGAYKPISPIYPTDQGVSYGHHHHHSYEDSYNQQRSPMNPRFQNILSPTRDSPRLRPVSIVLRYRSESIAQQLCLIEIEQLNQVLWYELVNAGWKKKSQEVSNSSPDNLTEDSFATSITAAATMTANGGDSDVSTQQAVANTDALKESDLDHQPAAVLSRRVASPWPLSRSQTARTYMQRFPHQSHTSDSPNVTQLVDRFNL
ncbi:hypothetical protein BGX27_000746, partial [Mortierella sp. AM989]